MKHILSIALLLPLSLSAKFAKIIQLDEPPRSAYIDDEVVYIVTTTVRKYTDARFDSERGQFVDARTKRILAFADGERITKLDRLGGIGTGGTITGYTSFEIKQGTVSFSYPFDAGIGTADISSNLLAAAVDGDRLFFTSSETNRSFVASFSPKDSSLHWLDPVTFEVCEPLPPPDHDREFRYSRMQHTNSIVSICGGRLQKDIGIIKFSEYDIDEVYRIVENVGPKNPIDENNILYKEPVRNIKSDRPSVLTPRKFYVVLADGRKAFGMFQPEIEKNSVLFSPITSAPLAVAKADIASFAPIDDGSFPTPECYSKNEIEELYKKFRTQLNDDKGNAPLKSVGNMLSVIVIALLGWLIPILMETTSDVVKTWFNAHPRVKRITLGLSLLAALLFLVYT